VLSARDAAGEAGGERAEGEAEGAKASLETGGGEAGSAGVLPGWTISQVANFSLDEAGGGGGGGAERAVSRWSHPSVWWMDAIARAHTHRHTHARTDARIRVGVARHLSTTATGRIRICIYI